MSERGTRDGSATTSSGVARSEFDALAEVVDGGVVSVDADGRIVGVDDEFLHTTGFDADAVVGDSIAAVLDDANAERVLTALGDDRNRRPDGPVEVRTASGTRRELEVAVRGARANDDGGAVLVFRDDQAGESAPERREEDHVQGGGSDSGAAGGQSTDQADALRRFHQCLTQSEASLEERVRSLLAIVRDVAGTEYGSLARVDGDRYVFEVVDGPPDSEVSDGDEQALSETNCERVVESEEALVLGDIQTEAPDLAARDGNQALDLSCYLGAPVVVDGDVYGTLCVYGPSTCEFSEWAVTFLDVAAAWVEHELEEERKRDRLRREHAEAERSRRRYETLVENFPNGAVALVDENLEYVTAGGEPVDVTTQSTAGLDGTPVREAVSDDFADALEPRYRAALNGESSTFEHENDQRVARIRVFPVRGDDGDAVAAMGMSQDVTEQTERRRRLAEYETIVETINDGIYVVDDEGRYETVNDAFCDLTGYSQRELLGKHARFVVEEGAIERAAAIREEADPDETPQMETTVYTADGDEVPVEVTFSRLSADGQERRVGVVRDVTERHEQRRQLAESEQRYRALVENLPKGDVGVFDEDLRYSLVDGTMWADIDVDTEDLEGKTIWEALPEDTAADIEPLFRAALHGETDSVVSTLDGRTYRVWATPLRNADGEITAGQSIARDITDQQEREQALERTLDLLDHTQRIADVGGWEVDPDTLEVFWSDHLFDLLAFEGEDEPPLDRALDVYHEADRELVAEAVERAMAEAEPFDVEARFRRPEGDLRWLRVQGAPETEEGEVVLLRGAAQDITERHERERALERQAQQQAVVAELGQFALETDDVDQLMQEAARQVAAVLDNDYCEVLDLDEDDCELLLRQGVGYDDSLVGTATVDADADSRAGYTLRSDEPVVVDDVDAAERFAGSELSTKHDVASGISTIVGSVDDPWGVLATHDTDTGAFTEEDVNFVQSVANILADAIERERTNEAREALVEELEASNQRLEEFAYAASHDLQEPLRMVSSYLSLVKERYGDELDEDGEDFIDYAVDGAERMQQMIDALLEYARVETRGESLRPVDLDDVFAAVRQDYEVRIEETDAEVTAASLPRVRGDPDQLRQVFGNLLGNAIEYSGDDPPEVSVSAERDGEEWVVAVSDEGIGIDAEHTDQVFEVFERLHSHDEHPGTGIGLALTQRIVQRHGGEVWVESEPGEGSTFYVRLSAADEVTARG